MKLEKRTEKSLLPMKNRFLDSERGGGKKVKLDPLGFHIHSLISITHIASRHVWWFQFQGSYHISLHETQHHWLNLKHICPSETFMGNRDTCQIPGKLLVWVVHSFHISSYYIGFSHTKGLQSLWSLWFRKQVLHKNQKWTGNEGSGVWLTGSKGCAVSTSHTNSLINCYGYLKM